uniref:Histone H2A n=1 Tax=Timema shepardi TaxID=629360 RepID=A0A7R9AWM1_TIMSH|nr:unnamed protein product [Timema shepardi]
MASLVLTDSSQLTSHSQHIGRTASRSEFDIGAPVYLAAVTGYLVAEVLELSGDAARDSKKTRIIQLHQQLAIRNDEELNNFFSGVTVTQNGVLPNIHAGCQFSSLKRYCVRVANSLVSSDTASVVLSSTAEDWEIEVRISVGMTRLSRPADGAVRRLDDEYCLDACTSRGWLRTVDVPCHLAASTRWKGRKAWSPTDCPLDGSQTRNPHAGRRYSRNIHATLYFLPRLQRGTGYGFLKQLYRSPVLPGGVSGRGVASSWTVTA